MRNFMPLLKYTAALACLSLASSSLYAGDDLFFLGAPPASGTPSGLWISTTTLLANDGGASTIAEWEPPSHGALTATQSGFTYVPDPSLEVHGVDSFRYRSVGGSGSGWSTVFLVRDLEEVGGSGFGGQTASGGNAVLVLDIPPGPGLPIPGGSSEVWLFRGQGPESTATGLPEERLRVMLTKDLAGQLVVWAEGMESDGTFASTASLPIPSGPVDLGLDWQVASSPSARDGLLVLRYQDSYVSAIGLDNSDRTLRNWETNPSFSNLPTGSGMVPSLRRLAFPPAFRDGFEAGHEAGWTSVHAGGANPLVFLEEPLNSNRHSLALPLGAKEMYLEDATIAGARSLEVRFELETQVPACMINTTALGSSAIPFLEGVGGLGEVLWSLELRAVGANLELKAAALQSQFGGKSALAETISLPPGKQPIQVRSFASTPSGPGGLKVWLGDPVDGPPDIHLALPALNSSTDLIRFGSIIPTPNGTGTLCLDTYTSLF